MITLPDYPSVTIPEPWLTTDRMREVDRLMIEKYGITLLQMMENAGRNLADFSVSLLKKPRGRILISAGKGHNGGGGLTAARHLYNRGWQVTVWLPYPDSKLKPVTAHQLNILKHLGVEIISDPSCMRDLTPFHLIIDALVGYGLKGELRETESRLVSVLNRRNIPLISLDAPTGLDTDDGANRGGIKADCTLTLAYPKTGLGMSGAKAFTGELLVGDISVPPEVYEEVGIDNHPIFSKSPILHLEH